MSSKLHGERTAAPLSGDHPHTRAVWMRHFLAALAERSNVTFAAEMAAIKPALAYKVRREDPEFARRWQGALCEGYDNLEFELLDRLRNGVVSDDKGRKFDNAVALRLLAAHRESVARERALRDNEDAAAVVAAIDAKIDAMRQRALAAGKDIWAAPGDDD
jgi:hypothetical protein